MKENRPRMSIKEFQEAAVTMYEPHRIPVILWGQTGIGKTDVLLDIAEKTDRILRVFYPAGMEPSDLSGLPMQSSKNLELVEFKKTDMIHFEKGKRYILFFDELNRAALDMQQAVVPMYNSSPYFGVHEIQADVWIVTAMNDTALQEGVMVSECDDALLTRSAQIVLSPLVKEVAAYLNGKYANNIVASFMSSNYIADAIAPDFADVYKDRHYVMPTPRNFEKACQMVSNLADPEQLKKSNVMRLAMQSILGTKVTTALVAYLEELKKLDPELLFGDGKQIKKQLVEACEKVDQINTTMLLNAFQAAVRTLKDRSQDQIKHFIRNLLLIEKDKSGKNAYSETIAAVYATIRNEKISPVITVLADEEFIGAFLQYHAVKK